jgi:large subunit ribosomal protein L17
MRHGNAFRKFSRTSAHRQSMLRNMATSLVLKDGCRTTIEKAKELRRVVEKLVTASRADTLAARKNAHSYLKDKTAVARLFTVIGPRFKTRPGGYTRITRLERRTGDAAQMAFIEFVDRDVVVPAKVAPSKSETGKDAGSKVVAAPAKTAAKKPAKKKAAAE